MRDEKRGTTRRRVSGLATLVILGYIGSYTPSLLAWWEQTWYPHGREARIIKPDPNAVVYQLVMPEAVADGGGWHQEVEAGGGDLPLVIRKRSPRMTAVRPTEKSMHADQQGQIDQQTDPVLNLGVLLRETGETS
ncbi:MAG: hypothetical protein P8L85_14950 [Rubripirellula sp.]|nr:hypothetical protein [Rubripirellula sp.]